MTTTKKRFQKRRLWLKWGRTNGRVAEEMRRMYWFGSGSSHGHLDFHFSQFSFPSRVSLIVKVRSHIFRNGLSPCSASMFPCFLHGCLCIYSCWLAKEICMFSPLVHISANTGDDLLHYTELFSHCYKHFTKKE